MMTKETLLDSLLEKCLADNGLKSSKELLGQVKKIFQKAGKRIFTPELRAQLKTLGIHEEPQAVSHAEVNQVGLKAQGVASLEACANAFIAGLTPELMALRAPLRAFTVLANYPDHEHSASLKGLGRSTCRVCGYSKDALTGEYCSADLLQGLLVVGIHGRVSEIFAAGKTLEWFATLPRIVPDGDQVIRFEKMLEVIDKSKPAATVNSLRKDLSPMLGGDTYNRLYVLETLGYAGVLNTKLGESLPGKWLNRGDIKEHPAKFNEAESPSCFWKREMGFNEKQFKLLFPAVKLPKALVTT